MNLSIFSWVIYDIGNTLFNAGVTGLFFPLWIITKLNGTDATVGYTLSIALLVSLMISPIVGALSDQTKNRKIFLGLFTVVCGLSTTFIGNNSLINSLIYYGISVTCLHVGDIFYNSMLKDVSNKNNIGIIGGIGAGVGYIGAIIAILIGLLIIEDQGYPIGFTMIGLLIIFFGIPILIFLKEKPQEIQNRYLTSSESLIKRFINQISHTLEDIKDFPGLNRFLIARFWYSWALYTASTFTSLYILETIGMSEREIQYLILTGIITAIPSALIWGKLVDKYGAKSIITIVLILWLINLGLSIGSGVFNFNNDIWWFISGLTGILISGVWSCDRPFMHQLISDEFIGEYFGLHGFSGRLGSIIGTASWGFIATTLNLGQPIALLSLGICILLSLIIIINIDVRKNI
ncbi:MAG: MFS transporter [Dehalococcoidia bacterium]